MPALPDTALPDATVPALPEAAPDGGPHRRLAGTGWLLWRDVAVRGAGFPARRLLEICDDQLADAADAAADGLPGTLERYQVTCAAAEERLTAAIRRTAGESRFREAVTWQNPALVRDCLDKVVAGERRNVRGRYHELTVATYLQRYCLKNDTVGFFGPVGWARIGDDHPGLAVASGAEPLSRRTTYFENWAIDAVAEMLAARPEVWPWLRPRIEPSAAVTGWLLHLPFRKRTTLSAGEVRVLELCDGSRTVREIAGDPPDPETLRALLRLRHCGAVRIGLTGRFVTWPERELADRLAAIPDAGVRARARQPLDELVAARDAVAAAAGQPDRLLRASTALAETFERITGTAATRHAGLVYAGRTILYEDTVRAADIRLGPPVLDELARPLGLVLDSALWLANTVAGRYQDRARQLLRQELTRTGGRAMPLLQLLTALMPELGGLAAGYRKFDLVDEVVAEFQERWRRVLGLSAAASGEPRFRVSADAIARRAAREFATGPPRWSGARWSSPDVMLAADGADAVRAGDLEFVLGELHCATNTLESRLFVAQHPDPSQLRDSAVASGLDDRIVFMQRTDNVMATSRMSRAAELMLASYGYLGIGAEEFTPPPGATVLSVMDLSVQEEDGAVVVRHRASGRRYDFLEVIGGPLSVLVSDAFRPFGAAGHRPRVTIGRLVVDRESWTFPAAGTAWAFVKDERRRYLEARRWRAEHRLTERGFVRVPVERKPMAVDFRSLPLVNLLAKSIRRTAEQGAGDFTISEMMPDVDRLWLCDTAGDRYTAEFRLVAVRAPS
jgi:hypothetical protein